MMGTTADVEMQLAARIYLASSSCHPCRGHHATCSPVARSEHQHDCARMTASRSSRSTTVLGPSSPARCRVGLPRTRRGRGMVGGSFGNTIVLGPSRPAILVLPVGPTLWHSAGSLVYWNRGAGWLVVTTTTPQGRARKGHDLRGAARPGPAGPIAPLLDTRLATKRSNSYLATPAASDARCALPGSRRASVR